MDLFGHELSAFTEVIRELGLSFDEAFSTRPVTTNQRRRLTIWRLPSGLVPGRAGLLIQDISGTSRLFCIASAAVNVSSCLQHGAHDALADPYDPIEALARVRRLVDTSSRGIVNAGDVSVSLGTGELTHTSAEPRAARPRLRSAELKVLRYLALQTERYVSAAELQESVLRTSGNGAAVRFHIKELRRKLGKAIIESRRGYGYRVREDLT